LIRGGQIRTNGGKLPVGSRHGAPLEIGKKGDIESIEKVQKSYKVNYFFDTPTTC